MGASGTDNDLFMVGQTPFTPELTPTDQIYTVAFNNSYTYKIDPADRIAIYIYANTTAYSVPFNITLYMGGGQNPHLSIPTTTSQPICPSSTNIVAGTSGGDSYYGYILMLASFIFLIVRLVLYKEKSPQMFFLTGTAMILMAFGTYFIMFPGWITTATGTANVGNVLVTLNASAQTHPIAASFTIPTIFFVMLVYEIVCALVIFGDASAMGLSLFKK
jgi:hypothetical protein